jgi:hypothetical protein
MSQPSNSAVRGSPVTSAAAASPAAATGDFVVNLCASTTPMALAKPSAPELARYTFFVSRRREEGRERFRLHMGYFATRDEAEQMLALVRDLYPAAWVGETPGRKLASAARGAAAAPSDVPVEPAAPAAARSTAPAAPAAPASAPAAAVPAPTPTPTPATKAPAARVPTASVATPPVAASPPVAMEPQPVASGATASTSTAPTAPAAAATRKPASARTPPVPPASNVREVIAALEPEADTAASGTVQMPVPPPPVTAATRAAAIAARNGSGAAAPPAKPKAPAAPAAAIASRPAAAAAPAAPAVKPPAATPAPVAAAGTATAPAAAATATAATARTTSPSAPAVQPGALPVVQSTLPGSEMTDSQVLRVLEGPGTAGQRAAPPSGVRDIALLSPQDTQTWRDIKAQIKRDAVVHFAVQLNWSVTPIELARVPSLAIFNAYTLYKIEGNREGRKWYGLRLGFFSDAMSAKQVAHYVRSEFAQVAVVPVSVNEREQAKQIGAIALPAASPAARSAGGPASDEFKLIDDEPAPPQAEQIQLSTPAPTPARPVAASPAAHAPAATTRRPNRPRGAPQSLEETLEILGASQLSIDTGRGERVVIDGRARAVEPPTSTFSRLLDRLGEKLRK